MIKVLLREAVLTAVATLMASVVAFAALDRAMHPDWFGVVGFATLLKVPPERLLGRDLPLIWNPRPLDAAQRTARDIAALAEPARCAAAQARITARGTAGLPSALARLPRLPTSQQRKLLVALAGIEAGVSASDPPPNPGDDGDLAPAKQYWERYDAAHGLDFRESYANRQASRILGGESRNASERIAQLGTYALPALMRALGESSEDGARVRVVSALADLTGVAIRVRPGASDVERRFVLEAWRAWWFVNRANFTTLAPWQRSLERAFDARYGRWVARALRGRMGVSAVTRRSIGLELRERVAVSALTSGVGGLFGVGIAIAFGGAEALRRRPLRARLLDLVGAVVPGLIALVVGWLLMLRLLYPYDPISTSLEALLARNSALRTVVASLAGAALPGVWLMRPRTSKFLDAVRSEAESWTVRGQVPSLRRALRHAARIAAASLLCPLALAAPLVLMASILVETALGVQGMGSLTAYAAAGRDGAWLLVAVLTVVPVLLARRWSALLLVWVLGTRPDGRVRRFRSLTLSPPPPES